MTFHQTIHIFIAPAFHLGLWDLRNLKAASKDRGKEGVQYLSPFTILCNQVPHLNQHWAHIFPSLYFDKDVLNHAMDVKGNNFFKFHLGFSFNSLIPGYSGKVSVSLPRHLSLLPPPLDFCVWVLLGVPCSSTRPLGTFTWLPLCWNALLLSWEKMILEY